MAERAAVVEVRTPEGVVFAWPLAGPVARFLAVAIDTAVILAAGGLGSRLLVGVAPLLADAATALTILLYFALWMGYGILLEGWNRGQTLGKRALGLRVIDIDGLRLGLGQVVVRNLLRAVDLLPGLYGVGGAACLLSPLGQRLGDIAAGTLVVRTRRTRAPDLTQAAAPSFNTLREHPALVARLRRNVSAREAAIALDAVLRRDRLEPRARVALFRDIATHLRGVARFPEAAVAALPDEQLVRAVVDVLFTRPGPRESAGNGGNGEDAEMLKC